MAKDFVLNITDPATAPLRDTPFFTVPNLFDWLGTMFQTAHQTTMDREIEAMIGRNGGRLTDDLERELSRRFA